MNVAQFPRRERRDSPTGLVEKLRQAGLMVEEVAYDPAAQHAPHHVAHLLMISACIARIVATSGVEELDEVASLSR